MALWRPLEILLYDWWPIRAEAQLYDRLSAMPVRLVRRGRGMSSGLGRGFGYLVLWVVLMGAAPGNLAVGSRRRGAGELGEPPAVAARRAAHPLGAAARGEACASSGCRCAPASTSPAAPSIRPCRSSLGFIRYRVGFPPGPARNVFTALTSLLPGTVPVGEQDGAIVYHCLDVDQPVADELAAEEADLRPVLGESRAVNEFLLFAGSLGARLRRARAASRVCAGRATPTA